MKAVKFTVEHSTYYLALNGAAMFEIRDRYGSTTLLLEALEQDTGEGFQVACEAAAILAEQGELVRRQFGYTAGEIPDAQTFALLVEPYRLGALKNAVIRAITIGYGREITAPGDDEYDEGLAELHQKKNTIARAEYFRIAIRCGLSVRESLLMPPGEVFDLWELYSRAHRVNEDAAGDGDNMVVT